MEADIKPEKQQGVNLKQERQAITPAEDSWFDNDSNCSQQREEEDSVKVEVSAVPKNEEIIEDKNENVENNVMAKVDRKDFQKQYKFIQHYVDRNYLTLMIVLRRHQLLNIQQISGLKQGQISLLGKENKLIVKALSNKQGNEAIQRISDFIDNLNILKTSIKHEAALRISHFKKLKAYLSKDKIAIFSVKNKDQYELYVGGEMKPSQLKNHINKINQIKVQPVFLRVFQNKRSYRIILNEILNTQFMQQALLKFNNVNFAQVQGRNSAREIKLVLGSFAKKQVTPPQYQDFIMKQLSNYYVIVFCLQSEKYFEKLKCEKITFKYIKESKFPRSYLFIIALRQDFFKKSEEISQQLQKIADKIMGIRFFVRIAPQITSFDFDKDIYHLFRFPQSRPYSIVLTARRKEGNVFKWRDVYNEIVGLGLKK